MTYKVADLDETIWKTNNMYDHFSRIATQYQQLRTTDLEPISFMVRKLNGLPYIKAVDVGCGDGRYNRILCRYLGDKMNLTCVDVNAAMLDVLHRNLTEDGIRNFNIMQASADDLPLPDNSHDCVFTLNAIHHFDLSKFIRESARILKNNGYLFAYTRLREQNRKNIWGRYFPGFCRKETRLYTLNQMVKTINAVPGMRIQSVEYFRYHRLSTLPELEKRIRSYHYSTFFLYPLDELEKAIDKFKKNIIKAYQDVQGIHWYDENILVVVRKGNDNVYDLE
jgi:ubiquinone/menaquinone biosynthesis C-methylase UbiE